MSEIKDLWIDFNPRTRQDDDEFPNRDSLSKINRRDLLKYLGGTLALAGVSGCRGAFMPQQKLVPYDDPGIEPPSGEFVYFRTAAVRNGYAFGVHVATREGRPIKIEGNPDHPASIGTCDPATLAEILTFYDPDRAKIPERLGEGREWQEFFDAFGERLRTDHGSSVRILRGPSTSPTLERQISRLLGAYPGLRVHVHDPMGGDLTKQAAELAFGKPMLPLYRLERCKLVLFVDFGFDRAELGDFRLAADLMAARREGIVRIVDVHTMPGLASGFADHSRPLSPVGIDRLLEELLAGQSSDPWSASLLAEFQASAGSCAIVAGRCLSLEQQAAILTINQRLKAPIKFIPPPESDADPIDDLITDMNTGSVGSVLVVGLNPVYDVPEFADALAKVPFKAQYGLYRDETAEACDWRLPATHFFEHLTDARGFDGTASICQPLILPLGNSKSPHELIAGLLGDDTPPIELLKDQWKGADWASCVRSGIVPNTAASPIEPPTSQFDHASLRRDEGGFTILLRPDPLIGDGSRANNGWLRELGQPVTTVAWENVIHVSPKTAAALLVESGRHARVGEVEGPILVTPGHADDCATIHLGYGRRTGSVAALHGFDAYPLQRKIGDYEIQATLEPIAKSTEIAMLQRYADFAGRDVIHEFEAGESFQRQDLSSQPQMYDYTEETARELTRPQWGMSIDLSTCIGCGACVAACVAENNIPVVGRDQVIVGRQMHWIRIDRYYSGDPANPRTFFQPLPCMHCETAPCEPVCPVAATVHSHEGLNQMIYNRCVGTRYCSNNCPYKVRRFNFLDYQTEQPNFDGRGMALLRLLNNPEVTVRSRGVMEKCSYCVQRIDAARIKAKEADREIRDGEVVTACQQACPTRAITFGDIADPQSGAYATRADARTYSLLGDLNTKPRTTYLARIRNSNPDLEVGHA